MKTIIEEYGLVTAIAVVGAVLVAGFTHFMQVLSTMNF